MLKRLERRGYAAHEKDSLIILKKKNEKQWLNSTARLRMALNLQMETDEASLPRRVEHGSGDTQIQLMFTERWLLRSLGSYQSCYNRAIT